MRRHRRDVGDARDAFSTLYMTRLRTFSDLLHVFSVSGLWRPETNMPIFAETHLDDSLGARWPAALIVGRNVDGVS